MHVVQRLPLKLLKCDSCECLPSNNRSFYVLNKFADRIDCYSLAFNSCWTNVFFTKAFWCQRQNIEQEKERENWPK